MQAAARDVPAAGESDASAHFFVMSGWQSQWPLPNLSTTAHSARRWLGPGREVRVEVHANDPEQPPSQSELFDVFDEEPGGSRPPCLGELRGPQVVVQRRYMEHMADMCPF